MTGVQTCALPIYIDICFPVTIANPIVIRIKLTRNPARFLLFMIRPVIPIRPAINTTTPL